MRPHFCTECSHTLHRAWLKFRTECSWNLAQNAVALYTVQPKFRTECSCTLHRTQPKFSTQCSWKLAQCSRIFAHNAATLCTECGWNFAQNMAEILHEMRPHFCTEHGRTLHRMRPKFRTECGGFLANKVGSFLYTKWWLFNTKFTWHKGMGNCRSRAIPYCYVLVFLSMVGSWGCLLTATNYGESRVMYSIYYVVSKWYYGIARRLWSYSTTILHGGLCIEKGEGASDLSYITTA